MSSKRRVVENWHLSIVIAPDSRGRMRSACALNTPHNRHFLVFDDHEPLAVQQQRAVQWIVEMRNTTPWYLQPVSIKCQCGMLARLLELALDGPVAVRVDARALQFEALEKRFRKFAAELTQ